MWTLFALYQPGMEGSGDVDDEQIMTTTRHRYDYDQIRYPHHAVDITI